MFGTTVWKVVNKRNELRRDVERENERSVEWFKNEELEWNLKSLENNLNEIQIMSNIKE